MIFIKGEGLLKGFFFFFLPVISSHLSTIYLKTFSSPLYWLPSFVKEQVIIFMGIYFWVLQSVSLFCLFFHQHRTVLIIF